ncbi:phage tail protein [Pseudorhizobium halotolerans]|uniref:Phage tail protein n=1 Tax=Pseudorhizobium halotolerans TaxID=1233081 RepID=A0ABM8PLD5_9HYPH|nr:hypothetical protein [Pseudorhizobium halotolerans]CAD7036307.1 phage tail protein [Pseudorhizobium halotolerans]
MDYIAPYGSTDPNASYVDRNTPGATSGSRVPAKAIENPMREIKAVIAGAGLSASNNDLTQLLQAIQALISQATGGGDTENFVLMAAARARLPIFPHVLTADGRIPIVSPSAGQVRIPAGYEFQHRGIFTVTTVQADFATAANKTYHLRWSPANGFQLKDLADSGYNPGALAETDASFDSKYDDALFSRVVTNGSNVPTITNLANLDRLKVNTVKTGAATALTSAFASSFAGSESINWARTPVPTFAGAIQTSGLTGPGGLEYANVIGSRILSRYAVGATVTSNWNESQNAPNGLTGQLEITAFA